MIKKNFLFFALLISCSYGQGDVAIKQSGNLSLSPYKNKTLLLVNIATRCGYTPQLKKLETLYQKFKEKDFLVLGVPSNDFGSQSPESNKEIKKICKLNYGVSFPILSKTVVQGENKAPLFKKIIEASGGKEIRWNFEKFLLDKKGRFVKRYSSSTSPTSLTIQTEIEKLIQKQ